ncbi:hypothetical protein [Arthrobacter sp. Leaf337]|uniref:hypothetical protein n=1 Tax=Arthrobacter sp. Leaf337 TaxID=1736342 RepID=UPI003FA46CBB
MGRHHMVALAWPATSGHIPDRDAARQRFGADAAHALGAAGVLTVEYQGMTLFWWGFNTRPAPSVTDVLREVPRADWIQLAVGRPGSGLTGLRQSHFEAQQAARVARLSPRQKFWNYTTPACWRCSLPTRRARPCSCRSISPGCWPATRN